MSLKKCRVILLAVAALSLVSACTPKTVADPARSGMKINVGVVAPTEIPTPTEAPAVVAPVAAAVPGQLLVTLVPGAKIAEVQSRHAFILGARLMPDGRYLVYLDPLTGDEADRAALSRDTGVKLAEPNRDYPPAVRADKNGKVPPSSGNGWVPPAVNGGIVGDTGDGGDSTMGQ